MTILEITLIALLYGVICFVAGALVGERRFANLSNRWVDLGANIVLKGQQINDQWDAVKTQGFAKFAGEMIRVVRSQPDEKEKYPPLLQAPPQKFFTVEGLDLSETEPDESEIH